MEYLMEYPSSVKCEATDAATEGSPQIFLGDFAQATQDLLMDESAASRASAARKLAKLGRSSATPYLIAALSDSSPEVRLAAAESLGHLGDSAAIAHLTDLLAREAHCEIEERIVSDAIHSIAAREGRVAATPPTIASEIYLNNGSLNSTHPAVDTNAQSNGSIGARAEPEFSFALEERLRSEEDSLKQATENLEQRRAEAERLHRAHDERERLAALEANRRRAEQQTQQRNGKEQKLLAEIEALREAEAEQRQRIEEANAAARRRSAEESQTKAESERVASRRAEEDEAQLAQLEAIRVAAESEAEVRATERQRLSAEIKTLSQVATEQIDRMDEAKDRLALLEQIRLHAETKVCERAEREIRLQAEIEALRQAEAAQLKRIEEAEAEARRLTEEQTRVQAAAEARRKAEALQPVADEARRLAEGEEKRLEHLETIRAKAEAAAQKRAEKERLLNSQLLAFGEAAAEQLKRIEKAEADLSEAEEALQQFEEKARQTAEHVAIRLADTETRRQAAAEVLARAEAEARALAEKEEQRLAELESLRSQAETRAQRRREQEQRLIAEIEGLDEIETEQLYRIAAAEIALLALEEGLQAAEVGVSQEEVDRRTELVTDSSDETEALPNDLQSETSNAETATLWSMSEHSDQSNANVAEEVELVSDERIASSLVDTLEAFTPESSTEDSGKSIDSVLSEEGIQAASQETPIVTSLAERFRTGDPAERANALQELARLDENGAFSLITGLFDDSSEEVRNAAARALYDLSTDRPKTFTRALREAPPQRRRQIITALDASGLAAEAIDSLAGESREKTHDAFSMLFLMAKAGELQSLLQTIEKHPNIPVRLSVIKLLTFSSRPEIIPALRSLAVKGALPIDVRSALMKSIYEMSNGTRERSLSAA